LGEEGRGEGRGKGKRDWVTGENGKEGSGRGEGRGRALTHAGIMDHESRFGVINKGGMGAARPMKKKSGVLEVVEGVFFFHLVELGTKFGPGKGSEKKKGVFFLKVEKKKKGFFLMNFGKKSGFFIEFRIKSE
jgi:hypothetical protein